MPRERKTTASETDPEEAAILEAIRDPEKMAALPPRLRRIAQGMAAELRARIAPERRAVTIQHVMGARLREHRTTAGWSQQRLAEAMVDLGHDTWSRVTVAEAEAGERRRISIEEMLSLAALFGVPGLSFILPAEGEDMVLAGHEEGVPAAVVEELILGAGGQVGTGGPHWPAAEALAPSGGTPPHGERFYEGDWRPAPSYWAAKDKEAGR